MYSAGGDIYFYALWRTVKTFSEFLLFSKPSAFLFTLESQYQSHSWTLGMCQQEVPCMLTEG